MTYSDIEESLITRLQEFCKYRVNYYAKCSFVNAVFEIFELLSPDSKFKVLEILDDSWFHGDDNEITLDQTLRDSIDKSVELIISFHMKLLCDISPDIKAAYNKKSTSELKAIDMLLSTGQYGRAVALIEQLYPKLTVAEKKMCDSYLISLAKTQPHSKASLLLDKIYLHPVLEKHNLSIAEVEAASSVETPVAANPESVYKELPPHTREVIGLFRSANAKAKAEVMMKSATRSAEKKSYTNGYIKAHNALVSELVERALHTEPTADAESASCVETSVSENDKVEAAKIPTKRLG